MAELTFLRDLIILFGLAVVVVLACHRIKLPPMVGFLITGVIAGPSALALISQRSQVEALAELGVALLLFTIGIEFSVEKLIRIRSVLLMGGGIQVLATTLLTTGVALLFGFEIRQAVFLGVLVSLSSTAIVLKLLADRAEVDTPHGKISLAILIFQDLCVVPLMVLTPFIAGSEAESVNVPWILAKGLLLMVGAVLCGRFAVPFLLRQIVRTRSREAFLLVILILCFGAAWASHLAGLSLALGAFIAGLIVSRSEYSHQALGEVIPFREVFASVFLISIGMLLDLRAIQSPGTLCLAVAAILAIKVLVAWAAVLFLGYSFRVAVIAAFLLAQIGEFSFVLAQNGIHYHVLDPGLYQLFIASSVITMTLTPLLKALGPRIADRLSPHLPTRFLAARTLGLEPLATKDLEGHVVIIGYGVNGRNLSLALKQVSISYVVIEMNPETVAAERRKGEPIIYGDASNREVLEHAGIRRSRVLVIAVSDPTSIRRATVLARSLHPGLHIIVRTRYLQEMQPLLALGADEVVPEEFETAIEIFARTLRKLLVPRDVVERFVREARRDGYGILRDGSVVGGEDDARGFLGGTDMEVLRVDPASPLAGKSLGEADLRRQSGATVLALKDGGQFVSNPPPTARLDAGTVAVVFGTPEQVARTAEMFRAPPAPGPDASSLEPRG
jgi:CPA2 family monovalent cation:H+ antiporter-2